MTSASLRLATLAVSALALASSTAIADPKNPTYDDDIAPILRQHCNSCHNTDKMRGGLDASTFSALKAGGSSGEVIAVGDPDKSRLYTLTAHTAEPKMPPNSNKIDQAKIDLLKLWIEQGARENKGSKVVAVKPKMDLALKVSNKGKPEGPPPMPTFGKLSLNPIIVTARPNAVLALAASPWAPVIALGGQHQVLLYHADTFDLLGVLPFEHGQINSIKFSRNGKLLLVAGGIGGASGKAVLYEVETGKVLTDVGATESDAILDADLSPDQSMIAVGTTTKMVRIYSTADGSVLNTIKKHTDWVTAVEFSPDGVLLATGDRSNGLIVWEANTGREFYTLNGHQKMITDLSWRPDSNVLASASEDGTVKLWDMQTGNQLKSWNAHGGGVQSVKYAMDGNIATTGRDRLTKFWDGNGGAKKQFEAFPDLGLRVTVSSDNAKVIGGDWSGLVRVWSAADGRLLGLLDANPPALPERLKRAEAQVATIDARVKQTASALAAAQTNADNARKALEAARKAVTDTAKAAADAVAAVPVAKGERDKANAAQKQAEQAAKAQEASLKKHTDAAQKAKDAAAKDPKNAALAEAAKKANDAVTKAKSDLDAARKAVTDTTTAAKAAADKYAAAQKAVPTTAAAAKDAPKRVPPLEKAATDAAKAVAPAKVAADAAQAELTAAKAKVERLKSVTVASK